LLRDAAVRASHYLLTDLARLDNRIEAHLDGLRVSGDAGWEICAKVMSKGDAGEIFAGAILAFASGKDEPIQAALKAGTAAPDKARGLVFALGWLPFGQAQGPIKQLLAAEPPAHRLVGIAVFAIHRQHPGDMLLKAVGDKDPAVKARALRAEGELGLVNYHGELLVDFPGNPAGQARTARATVSWAARDAGRDMVLMFEQGDPHRPIVLGFLQPPVRENGTPEKLPPAEVEKDGERLVFTAEKELVFRCGEASITLTRAGKVLIRGAYLLSRSTGVNRIKGGSVQIN
jgi:hypothetical protein